MNDIENGMVVGAQAEWDERYGDSGVLCDDSLPENQLDEAHRRARRAWWPEYNDIGGIRYGAEAV